MIAYTINLADIKRDPAREGALDETGQIKVLPAEFWYQFNRSERGAFCVRHAVYCVPTTELIDWLRNEIGPRYAIEIGSGNGVLAKALGIRATDNLMQTWPEIVDLYQTLQQPLIHYGRDVLNADANVAVKTMKPDVVVGAWVTHKYALLHHARGGNMHGVEEPELVRQTDYIFIGNKGTHKDKAILELPHKEYQFPWLISRALNNMPNFIGVWKKQ